MALASAFFFGMAAGVLLAGVLAHALARLNET